MAWKDPRLAKKPGVLARFVKSFVRAYSYYGQGGGISNRKTGLGGTLDKTVDYVWTPSFFDSREILEILYTESHNIAKAIDIPVIDGLENWRQYEWDSEAQEQLWMDQENHFNLKKQIKNLAVDARIYGTAMLVMVTTEAPLYEPVDYRRIKKGQLTNMLLVDRYQATNDAVWGSRGSAVSGDIYDKGYGEPEYYDLYLPSGNVRVHSSRVVRMDGIEQRGSEKTFSAYDIIWGKSVIIRLLRAVNHEQAAVEGLAHLMAEADVGVFKVKNLADAHMGEAGTEKPEDIAERMNDEISIYRKVFVDAGGDYDRVSANLGQLPASLDYLANRIAEAEDIPLTRWRGTSPTGMQSAGTGEERNYLRKIQSMCDTMYKPALERVDMFLARNLGMDAPPEWEFNSVWELSDTDKATLELIRTEVADKAIRSGLLTVPQAQERLAGGYFYQQLEPDPNATLPGMMDPMQEEDEEEEPEEED